MWILYLFLHIRVWLCHMHIREFYFFLSNLGAFISFSSLISLAKTSSTMLIWIVKKRHPCLVPVLWRNAFSLLLLRMVLARVFHRWPLSGRGNSLLLLVCQVFLSWKILDFCQMIFLYLLRQYFIPLIWCITLIDFCMLNQLCIPGTNPI